MKKDIMILSTPNGRNHFYELYKKAKGNKPAWIGVDWAKDGGMNRGDVVKRVENITYVRFKTVSV